MVRLNGGDDMGVEEILYWIVTAPIEDLKFFVEYSKNAPYGNLQDYEIDMIQMAIDDRLNGKG